VLVITTTKRMLHRVLGNTANLRPAVTFHCILVVCTASLKERLVGTPATGNNSDLGTSERRDGLLTTGRKPKTGGALVFIVGDDYGKATRATGECAAVPNLSLNVADDGALRHLLQWEDIADGQGGLLPAVDELSRVHALCGDHELGVALVAVCIQELDLGDGGTTPRIVEDLLDDAPDVPAPLSVVDRTELDGALARPGVRLEDGGLSLSLGLLSSQ